MIVTLGRLKDWRLTPTDRRWIGEAWNYVQSRMKYQNRTLLFKSLVSDNYMQTLTFVTTTFRALCTTCSPGREVLPYKKLMGMWRWIGPPFYDSIDCNGVAFSTELLEWGCTFSYSWVRQFFIFTVSKRTRMFVLSVKSKVFFIQYRVDT